MRRRILALSTFIVGVAMLVYGSAARAATEQTLHIFNPYPQGDSPASNLIADRIGALYGTSANGGVSDLGTVYKLTPNSNGGWTESVLYSFKGNKDGLSPIYGLVFDAVGNLYGTTGSGGDPSCHSGFGCGTVFELLPDGSGSRTERVLHRFAGGKDGAGPSGGLLTDNNGDLYGVTSSGGDPSCNSGLGCGTVFELSPEAHGSWKKSVLYAFGGYSGDGAGPTGSLVQDEAGNLYGATGYGGADGCGTIFELSPSGTGWSETMLYSFSSSGGDGCMPAGGLLLDAAGNLYGEAQSNGGYGDGVVFELSPSSGGWVEDILYSFAGGTDGASPGGGLTLDGSGNLFGVTSLGGGNGCYGSGCGTAFQLTQGSGGTWTESVIHSFSGGADGLQPLAAPFLDSSGNVYVTASGGGRAQGGAVSKLTPGSDGSFTTTVLFGFPSTDGGDSSSTLIFDKAGNLYGTAYYGGSHGFGTVYKVSPTSGGGWTESVVYSFKGGKDGEYPLAGLVLDTAGNIYGTAAGGEYENGEVFKLSPNQEGGWTETVLYNFKGGSEGGGHNGLVFDAAGNLYGTANAGGNTGGSCYSQGCGIAFELSPNAVGGWKETVLWTFSGYPNDGSLYWEDFFFGPGASLVLDAEGNLYGTTPTGGASTNCETSGCGTVFKLTPPRNAGGTWSEQILHSFATTTGDGFQPVASLIFDPVGNLYGTTVYGGTGTCLNGSCGTVFQLSPSSGGGWNEQVLYNFCSKTDCNDGQWPTSSLIFDQEGNLYGTTNLGDTSSGNWGVAFMLSPGSGGNWTEGTIFSFDGGADGGSPYGGLVSDSSGNLYGATQGGGDNSYLGYGGVYELVRNGAWIRGGPWRPPC